MIYFLRGSLRPKDHPKPPSGSFGGSALRWPGELALLCLYTWAGSMSTDESATRDSRSSETVRQPSGPIAWRLPLRSLVIVYMHM
jgi:hypothetical protein